MVQRPLSDRLAAERARIAKAQDRVRKLEAQERRTDQARLTRRRILLGSRVLQELETDGAFAGELRRWLRATLPAALTRDTDRMLMAEVIDGGAGVTAGTADTTSGPDADGEKDVAPDPDATMAAKRFPSGESDTKDDRTA